MKSMKKFAACLLLVFCLAGAVSVDVPALNLVSTVQAASKVKISKTKASLEKGSTLQLKVSGTKKKIKWSTSNSKVATVNSKGKVTAKKAGTATITAKVSGKSYKCKVTVTTPAISKKTLKLNVKDTYTLKMTGTKKSVKWTSNKKSVATVSSKGKVTAKKAGTATITATVGGKKYTCKVTVAKKPAAVSGYEKLSQFITKYGDTNVNGNKFISADDYAEGMEVVWAIEYDAGKKEFSFVMTAERYDMKTAVNMTVKPSASGYLLPSCVFISEEVNAGFISEARIIPAQYTGTSDIVFTVKDMVGVTRTEVNQLSNALLQLSFTGWKVYLLPDTGLTLKDLGFTAYRG